MRAPLLTFLLLASPSVRAEEPLTPDAVNALIKSDFARLRASIPPSHMTRALVDKMELETVNDYWNYMRNHPAKSEVYPIDVKYVTQSLGKVVLPRLAETEKIISDEKLTLQQKQDKLKELKEKDERRQADFQEDFFNASTNRSAILEAAERRGNDKERYQPGNTFMIHSPLIGAALNGVDVALAPGSAIAAGARGRSAPPPDTTAVAAPVETVQKRPLTPAVAQSAADITADAAKTSGAREKVTGALGPDRTVPIDIPPSPWRRTLAAVNEAAPKAYSDQSGVALRAGRYSDASRWAKTALEFNPKDKNAMFVLASAKGRVDAQGASAASRAAASGVLPPAKTEMAGAGRVVESARSANAPAATLAAAPVPPSTREAAASAKTALRLGDASAALVHLDKALEKDPGNPELLGLRAQTLGRLGRWEEALAAADKALAIAPPTAAPSLPLLFTKALAENRLGRWRGALATSERMISSDPGNAWGYAARAHAWGGLGNRAEMISDANRAASLDPAFRGVAAAVADLQVPAASDMLFLFPGEPGYAASAPAAAPAPRSHGFGAVMIAAAAGGALLALGLLSLVLAPLKDAVTTAFTRAERAGSAVGAVPDAAPASALPLVRGQYQLVKQIGQGGMGTVFEGVDRNLGRRVAVKRMRDELRMNPQERERFVIEAKTVAALRHPGIVDIYAIAEDGDDVYLVFEFVEGRTVHDLVQAAGRLAPPEAVRLTRAMGEALAYAHSRGVIHRDMKPSNVMVSSAGAVKVMDFGIARMAKDAMTRYSMTNTVVGTPPYMAPEQEQGVVRRESDVYALAVCAYEMLTGKLPFVGMGAGMLMNKINMTYIPPSRSIAGLPEALDGVFLKAFQADPDKRWRTPQELVEALAAAAGSSAAPRG